MANGFTPRFVDLVRNYTTSVGIGPFVLGPAVTGYTSLANAIQPGESFYYSVVGFDKPTEHEIGRGTMNADRTIARDPIGGTPTVFTSGTKTIALVAAAEWYETMQAGGANSGNSVRVKTPYDFGAVGADTGSLDASADDSAALQAFFDDAFDPSNSGITYDWSGHWAVAKPLMFVRPLDYASAERNLTYHARRFVCGKLHVLPVARQPGGVAMDTVLTISGPHSTWAGDLFIHDGTEGAQPYASRRFVNGLKCMQMTQASIESVTVFGARRDAVIIDGNYGTWSVRDGTPYQAGSTSKNDIGLQIGRVSAVNCGSYHGTTSYGFSTPITAFDQGGWTGTQFSSVETDYYNSALQRSELTVASTAEIKAGDLGKVRTEIPGSTFVSIAADNAGSKLVWTAGDPVAAGLLVGHRFQLTDGNSVGANDGTWFEIVSFGGTSNREISVVPAPATESAKAYTQLNTVWSLHRVTNVTGPTKFLVYPFVPNGTNSDWYAIQGYAVNAFGVDTASACIGYVGGRQIGGGVRSAGLYGVHVREMLTDYAEVGLVIGDDYVAACIGTHVGSRHIEGTNFTVVQLSAATSWYFGDGSGVGDFSGIHLVPREYPSSGRINGALGGGTYISGARTSQFAVKTEPAVSRTATIFDAFSYIRFVSPTPAVLTIPHSVSTDFPLGTVIEIEQGGAGELSVAAAPGVTVNSRGSDLTLAGQFAVAALKKVGADTWTMTGDL